MLAPTVLVSVPLQREERNSMYTLKFLKTIATPTSPTVRLKRVKSKVINLDTNSPDLLHPIPGYVIDELIDAHNVNLHASFHDEVDTNDERDEQYDGLTITDNLNQNFLYDLECNHDMAAVWLRFNASK